MDGVIAGFRLRSAGRRNADDHITALAFIQVQYSGNNLNPGTGNTLHLKLHIGDQRTRIRNLQIKLNRGSRICLRRHGSVQFQENISFSTFFRSRTGRSAPEFRHNEVGINAAQREFQPVISNRDIGAVLDCGARKIHRFIFQEHRPPGIQRNQRPCVIAITEHRVEIRDGISGKDNIISGLFADINNLLAESDFIINLCRIIYIRHVLNLSEHRHTQNSDQLN